MTHCPGENLGATQWEEGMIGEEYVQRLEVYFLKLRYSIPGIDACNSCSLVKVQMLWKNKRPEHESVGSPGMRGKGRSFILSKSL